MLLDAQSASKIAIVSQPRKNITNFCITNQIKIHLWPVNWKFARGIRAFSSIVPTSAMFRHLILLLALLCVSCDPPQPGGTAVAFPVAVVPSQALEGVVVGVGDGDSITAKIDGKAVKVRLHGIDAPEKGQAFGDASKRALSALVYGKRVRIVQTDRDKWGRTVAEVYADGVRVSAAMVRLGMAWHFLRYAPDDNELAAAETAARKAKRGLWLNPARIAPWDWRKGSR